MRKIILYCIAHLGDNIFTFIYLDNIKKYLIDNNVYIDYYIKNEYVSQVQEFFNIENIKIFSIDNLPGNVMKYDIWIGNSQWNSVPRNDSTESFNTFLLKYFKLFSSIINIPFEKDIFMYNGNELVNMQNNMVDQLKNIDILVINSHPMSGQYKNYNVEEWGVVIKELNKKYKVITTLKIDGVSCTLDYGLTIKQIAAIGTSVKYIIAINTGPFIPLLNDTVVNTEKKVFVFDNNLFFDYNNFTNLKNINDIKNYIIY